MNEKVNDLTTEAFDEWLKAYGDAWQRGDLQAAARLFAADARYYWTPFEPPKVGRGEIAAAWGSAISRQQDIDFRYTIWSVSGSLGVAQWHTTFIRRESGQVVEIDGVMYSEFDSEGRCSLFREWWHSDEPRDAGR